MAARKASNPNPQKALRELDALLKRGLPKVVMVTGESDFFRARAVERLMRAVPEDADLRTIDGNDVRAASGDDAGAATAVPELLDLRGGGLFASRVVVVVRRAGNYWGAHIEAIAETAGRIAEGSCLVLEAPTLDRRKKVAAQLVKETAAAGGAFAFRNLYDKPFRHGDPPFEGELCQWLLQTAKQRSVPLMPEAAWTLVTHVGAEPGLLFAEVERLRDQLGAEQRRAPLSPDDLRGRMTVSFSSDPFEFAEAVLSGDRAAALRSLRGMFSQGLARTGADKRDTGGVLPMVTSWLFRELCQAHEGRLLLDKGVLPRDLAAQAGVHRFQDRFVAAVRKNDVPRLRRGLQALHACQRKSRLHGESAELLLERFVAQWFDGASIETAEELEL